MPGLADEPTTARSVAISAPSDSAFAKPSGPELRPILRDPEQLGVPLRRRTTDAPSANTVVEPAVRASNGSLTVIDTVLTADAT